MDNLTAHLRNSPALIKSCETIISPKCCTQILADMTVQQPATVECLKMATSRLLGYSIIFASSLVKLPQLVKIFAAGSSAGLSFVGTFLELLAVTFNASYSYAKQFPFSAWGEAIFLLVETALIAFFILWYNKQGTGAVLFATVFTALVAILLQMNAASLWYLQAFNVPLAVIGKLLQAKNNLAQKHTGQMSAVTVFALFLGCVVRIFTSIQETGDQIVIATYAAASLANFVLVLQIFYYWNNTNEFLRSTMRKSRDQDAQRKKCQ